MAIPSWRSYAIMCPPEDGLVFLRYLSAAFARKASKLREMPPADAEDREEYQADNVFWVPLEMIEPCRGRIYDCCHGTGGFYVQSNRFVLAHSGRLDDLTVYGQERNPETYRLARMNLAIRGRHRRPPLEQRGTLLKDAFPEMRFDLNLANPPLNIKEWGGEFLREDAR